MKSRLLMILTACSISACTSLEVVHEPVGCEGQPNISIGLTAKEYNETSKEVLNKVVIFAKKLRKRIDTQCEINYKHDEIHGDNK